MPKLLLMFIMAVLGHIVGRLVILLGIGVVTYTGFQSALNFLDDFVQNQFSGLPQYVLQLMGMLHLDTAIAIITAAYITRWTIVLVSGALSRFRAMPGPGSIFS